MANPEADVSPFDTLAADYDAAFTRSAIGSLMRAAVWERMDAVFRPGAQILELNCGTGEDALYLARRGVRVLATDGAAGMVDVARAKAAAAGMGELIHVAQFDLAELAEHTMAQSLLPPANGAPYDGALSNFGGLNCIADLAGVARGLAHLLRPGAPALLGVMGPLAPWEWAWYLARGEPQKAVRRLRPGGVPWRGLTIRYPSISALQRAFAPWFTVRRVSAVGALLPPSYMEAWARQRLGLLWAGSRIERRFATRWPLPWLADHYLIELERA